jgi:Cadherin-like domain
MARLKSKIIGDTSVLFDPSDDLPVIEDVGSTQTFAPPIQTQAAVQATQPASQVASTPTLLDDPVVPSEFSLASSQLTAQLTPALTPLDDPFCPRQISFTIPGQPGVQVTATENSGNIDFTVDVLDSSTLTGDLRGLFFQFNESKLGSLQVTGGEGLITDQQIAANAVINLGNGDNMLGAASPFDVGIEFGTQGIGKGDDISGPVHFTLSDAANDLTLDDFALLQFGARVTSIGDPAHRVASEKIVAIAPAAPHAFNDDFKIFEDGASGLNAPSKTPTAVTFDVLLNDKDADTPHDQLIITGFHDGPAHGTVAISADGHSVLYTPALDYSGSDSFVYCMSDGHGGQDSATVNVSIDAVADVPKIDFNVLPGADVYHFILDVTATQNDADGSEFIKSIDAALGGLPDGVSVAPLGVTNSGPGQLEQQFMVTLPQDRDSKFDLTFTAVSQETSNGDQETATKTVPIELDFNQNFFNPSFFADDQNIWGPGPAFNFHDERFIGLDKTFDPPQIDFLIPPTPFLLFGDAFIQAKVGFDFNVSITGGQLDAALPCDVTLDTAYNKTTDQLLVDPTFKISAPGATIDAMGPGGSLSIDPIFDTLFKLQAGLDVVIDTLNLVNIDQRVNPDLPGLSLSTGDAHIDFPLAPGFSLGFAFPQVDPQGGPSTADPLVAHDSSDNFVQINLDVDQFAANFFPPIAAIGAPIPFDVPIPLVANISGSVVPFDSDVTGGLKLSQDLSMHVVGLKGTLTYENNSTQDFQFGHAFTIDHAKAKDANGDSKIDFSLSITPEVELTNNTDIVIDVNLGLELFRISGTFSPIVGDDSHFNTALVNFHQGFDIASIPVLHSQPFDLNFGSQDFTLGVDTNNQLGQLVQAMAGFGGGSGAAESLSTVALGADTSQQTLLTTPQHA